MNILEKLEEIKDLWLQLRSSDEHARLHECVELSDKLVESSTDLKYDLYKLSQKFHLEEDKLNETPDVEPESKAEFVFFGEDRN